MVPSIARCLAVVVAIATTVGASFASAWVFHQDDRQRSHSTLVGTLTVELPEGFAAESTS